MEDFGYFGDEAFLEPYDLDRQMMDWNIHNDHAGDNSDWEDEYAEAEFARGFDEAHARTEEEGYVYGE